MVLDKMDILWIIVAFFLLDGISIYLTAKIMDKRRRRDEKKKKRMPDKIKEDLIKAGVYFSIVDDYNVQGEIVVSSMISAYKNVYFISEKEIGEVWKKINEVVYSDVAKKEFSPEFVQLKRLGKILLAKGKYSKQAMEAIGLWLQSKPVDLCAEADMIEKKMMRA